ncbi:hypothetical protein FOCC_FOCC008305 [Frankliniella occidentalis]|nr:hypothetical protein FOCC_FOCC008305 [Frankliniella occidentalis]
MGTRAQQKAEAKQKLIDMDKSELEALITSAIALANKPLQKALNTLTAEVTTLKKELQAKDIKINELEVKLDELEQYGRRNNLRIFGVQETDDENTDAIVVDVAKKMNTMVYETYIDRWVKIWEADNI